jgi:isocitrate dehydrogenase
LRWDSLGEFLALAVSIEDLADKTGNNQAHIIADSLNKATSKYLETNKSPSRRVNELDNRGSHYYLAMYWAEAIARNPVDQALADRLSGPAKALAENEVAIVAELNAAQGSAIDIGGYYQPDNALVTKAMRPSETLNGIIDAI